MKYQYHEDMTQPADDEIFVFGSNQAGIHGAGAALHAKMFFGAQTSVGVGFTGRCYAFPTKDFDIMTRPTNEIQEEADRLHAAVREHPNTKFFFTRLGCGLAGFQDHEIAPLFVGFPENCNFPEEWRQYLEVAE